MPCKSRVAALPLPALILFGAVPVLLERPAWADVVADGNGNFTVSGSFVPSPPYIVDGGSDATPEILIESSTNVSYVSSSDFFFINADGYTVTVEADAVIRNSIVEDIFNLSAPGSHIIYNIAGELESSSTIISAAVAGSPTWDITLSGTLRNPTFNGVLLGQGGNDRLTMQVGSLIESGDGRISLRGGADELIYNGGRFDGLGYINFGSGDDLLELNTTLDGTPEMRGGTGTDTLRLNNSGSFDLSTLDGDWDIIDMNGTAWTLSGATASTFSSGIDLASGGTLTLDISGGDQSIVGNIIGTGSLTKTGTDILTLTGTNTYSGATIVDNGTLQIGNGGTTGTLGSGDVTNNSALIFKRSDGVSYNGAISGTGTLTQEGTGTLTLSGTNTYSGTTAVNAGTLSVNGSIADSATTVNNGATLAGSGTVGDLTLNGGTLAPGNSIGTLNVSGNVDFSSGVYEVEVDDAGNSDRIVASGNADLSGARVSILPEAGSYADSTDYTILQAGSISNSFTGVSVDDLNFAFLDASLSYSATDVTLSLVRNDNDFTVVAETPNQFAVSQTLQTLNDSGAASGMPDLLGEITVLSSAAARDALDQLSGAVHGHGLLLSRQSQQRFGRLLSSRSVQRSQNRASRLAGAGAPLQLASLDTPIAALSAVDTQAQHGSQYWFTPVYGEGDVDGDGNASGMDYHYAGLSLGVDQQLNADWLLGAALSYTQSDARFAAGSTDMDGVEAALYSRWDKDAFYLQGYSGLGWYGSDSERRINVGGRQTAESDYDTTAFFAGIEGGHSFVFKQKRMLTPYIGLDYAYSDRESFSESGAGAANLDVSGESLESIQSRAGLRFEQFLSSAANRSLVWHLNAAWLHEFGDDKARTQAGFVNNRFASFEVDGADMDRDRLLLGTGLAMALGERATLSFAYEGEFSDTEQDQQISASYRYQW